MRNRRRKESSSADSASWMTTYGDMVTLILTFFVLLFSFSTIDANKWRELVSVLSGGSGIINVDPSSLGPIDELEGDSDEKEEESQEDKEKEGSGETEGDGLGQGENKENFYELYIKMKEYVDAEGLNADLDILKGNTEITLRFKDNVIFDSGRAIIKKEATPILVEIGKILMLYQEDISMIMVEGHTDNVPIATANFKDNWELSTARALSVLRFFIDEQGMDPVKLSAIGYGEYHPIAKNDSDENRAQNRRVDIVIAKLAP